MLFFAQFLEKSILIPATEKWIILMLIVYHYIVCHANMLNCFNIDTYTGVMKPQ